MPTDDREISIYCFSAGAKFWLIFKRLGSLSLKLKIAIHALYYIYRWFYQFYRQWMKLKNAKHTCICIHSIVMLSVQKQFPIDILQLFHYLLKNFLPAKNSWHIYFWAYKSQYLRHTIKTLVTISGSLILSWTADTETWMADREATISTHCTDMLRTPCYSLHIYSDNSKSHFTPLIFLTCFHMTQL